MRQPIRRLAASTPVLFPTSMNGAPTVPSTLLVARSRLAPRPCGEIAQATIDKMRVVRAAALAPAEPSPQDRAVAAEAMQLMLQAQAELSSELGRTDESGQSEVSEDQAGDESSAKQSQEATNAYQVISGVGSNDVSANPSSSFRATA